MNGRVSVSGMTRRTDRVRDGLGEALLIRLTGVGTSGGWGVGARGGIVRDWILVPLTMFAVRSPDGDMIFCSFD